MILVLVLDPTLGKTSLDLLRSKHSKFQGHILHGIDGFLRESGNPTMIVDDYECGRR